MKRTIGTAAALAMAMALSVPAPAYADSGYVNEGPGVALEQKGGAESGVINLDSGSHGGGPGAEPEEPEVVTPPTVTDPSAAEPGAPAPSAPEQSNPDSVPVPPAEGGEITGNGMITPGQKVFNGVTLNYGVGNGGYISNMSLIFNSGLGGSISYTSSINNGGWLGWNYVGELNGATDGNADTRMEAVRISLSMLAGYNWDIYYRVTLDTIGQLGWAKNGEVAGTLDSGHYITDIDIQLVPKGQPGPESDSVPFLLSI